MQMKHERMVPVHVEQNNSENQITCKTINRNNCVNNNLRIFLHIWDMWFQMAQHAVSCKVSCM